MLLSLVLSHYSRANEDACSMQQMCSILCSQPKSCDQPRDVRSCTSRFLWIRTHDPACEAAKAAQNMVYENQKNLCESLRAQERALCESDKLRCTTVAKSCSAIKQGPAASKMIGANILWVDDHPANNRYEQQAFTNLGAKLTIKHSTNEAMAHLKSQRADLIISDFTRIDDPQAGYTLLEAIKARKEYKDIPVIIFTSSSNPTFAEQTVNRGGFGQTSDPAQLLILSGAALLR